MIFIANDDTDSHLLHLFLTHLYKRQSDVVRFPQIQTYLQVFFSSYSLCTYPSVYFLMSFYWKKSH